MVLIAASAAAAQARELRFEEPPRGEGLSVEAVRPRLSRAGRAWEAWEYAFRFPSGHTLLARMQVTNSGPGSHRALVVGMILAPDGTVTLIKNGRPRDRWSFAPAADGVALRVARHELDVGLSRHRLVVQNSRGRFSVEAEPTLAPLPIGRVAFSDERGYELSLLAPRLRARGRVQLPGQAEIDLGLGEGVALRSWSDVADFEQADAWLSVHTFDRPLQLSLLEFTTTRRLGRQRLGVLFVIRDGVMVLRTPSYERTLVDIEKDPRGPGYLVPSGMRLAASGRGRLSAEIRLRLRRRDDLLDWLDSRLVAFFVRQVAHPIQYQFAAPYRLELVHGGTTETADGEGIASLALLNRPPGGGEW